MLSSVTITFRIYIFMYNTRIRYASAYRSISRLFRLFNIILKSNGISNLRDDVHTQLQEGLQGHNLW